MYKLTIQTLTGNEKILYYPGNSDYSMTSGKLKLVVGSAGELNITIPMTNPVYDDVVRNSIITVYEDGEEIWRGDIRDTKKMFDKSLSVYALEDLAWLGEEPVAMTEVTNQTRAQRFAAAISAYNSAQSGSTKRQFAQGTLTIDSSTIIKWRPEWEKCSTLDCLRTFIAGTDGYVRIRRVTNNGVVTRYVDVIHLSDYGVQASQTITFGRNLLDFVKDIDTTNFVNALYPYGAETDETLYGDTMKRLIGTPIQNNDSIAGFGRRARLVTFETDSLNTLNRLAEAYLTRYSQPKMKIEVKAVDLGNIEEISRFHLGDSVRIVAHAFGVDQRDFITKQELDLLNIANNKIELSEALQSTSLTDQITSLAADIESEPSESSILNAAKKNTMSILDGSNGGNIYFKFDSNERITEMGFTNNIDLDQATAISRWNINGKAIMTRTYPSDPWTVKVAETIDGGIVADFITTGHLSCNRLDGGEINGQTIRGGSIYGAYINGAEIRGNDIYGGNISGSYISGGQIYGAEIEGGTINGAALTSVGSDSWVRVSAGNISGGYGSTIGSYETQIQFNHSLDGYHGNLSLHADGILLKSDSLWVPTFRDSQTVYRGKDGRVVTEVTNEEIQYIEDIWDNGGGSIGWRTVWRYFVTGYSNTEVKHGIVLE